VSKSENRKELSELLQEGDRFLYREASRLYGPLFEGLVQEVSKKAIKVRNLDGEVYWFDWKSIVLVEVLPAKEKGNAEGAMGEVSAVNDG